jgi:hypothetical protein
MVCQGFGSHSWRGCRGWQLAPSFGFWGHIPQTPCQGLCPLDPRLGPTRGEFVLYLKQGMESGETFRFLQDYTAKLEVIPD